MLRALPFIFVLLITAQTVRAEQPEACFPVEKIYAEQLPKLGGKDWIGHQLKRDGEVWHVIFTQKVEDTTSPARTWVLTTRHSAEHPEIYCIEGVGTRVDVLVSLHDSNFNEPFGLPGSNNPGCGKRGDPLEGVKVRAWASRELGDSVILSFDEAKAAGATYVLLMSKTDDYWIMLQQRAGDTTCYRDRGQARDMRAFKLR